MQFCAHFWELEEVSQLTIVTSQKLLRSYTQFCLFGTMDEDNAQVDACCCFSTPSIHSLSTLLGDESLCIIFNTGKAWLWCVIETFH